MKPSACLCLLAISGWALAAPAPAAAADAQALRDCRAIADALRRLACYDALPVAATPPVVPVSSGTPVTPVAPVVPVASASPLATAAAPAAAPSQPGAVEFGLEAQRAAAITRIESRIAGVFEGWGPNTRFTLANGQVWQVSDGSSAAYYLKDPQVTVARAALGSFRLEIEGARQAPRVRRVE